MERKSWRTLSDACRAGGEDLRLPELAELAHAVETDAEARREFAAAQAFDAQLREAVLDAPAPADLEARLLARLATAASSATERPLTVPSERVAEGPATETAAARPQRDVPPARSRARRWRWQTPLAVAAVLLLSVGVWRWLAPPTVTLPPDFFVQQVEQWRHEWDAADAWRRELPDDIARRYPLDPAVQVAPTAWRLTSRPAPGVREAVAYDLSLGRGRRAYLLVMPLAARQPGFDRAPPPAPTPTTGGWAVAAWQRDAFVYALVLEGGREQYRTLVAEPPVIATRDKPSPTGKV